MRGHARRACGEKFFCLESGVGRAAEKNFGGEKSGDTAFESEGLVDGGNVPSMRGGGALPRLRATDDLSRGRKIALPSLRGGS